MSFNRRMTRPDSNQNEIVSALRRCGVTVWLIGTPCDVLTYYRGVWRPIEIKKTGFKRPREDQEEQSQFLTTYAVPVVRTFEEAMQAVTQGVRP